VRSERQKKRGSRKRIRDQRSPSGNSTTGETSTRNVRKMSRSRKKITKPMKELGRGLALVRVEIDAGQAPRRGKVRAFLGRRKQKNVADQKRGNSVASPGGNKEKREDDSKKGSGANRGHAGSDCRYREQKERGKNKTTKIQTSWGRTKGSDRKEHRKKRPLERGER